MKFIWIIGIILLPTNFLLAFENKESVVVKIEANLKGTDFIRAANETSIQADARFQRQINFLKRKYEGQTLRLKLAITDVKREPYGQYKVAVKGSTNRYGIFMSKQQADHASAGDMLLVDGKVKLQVVRNGGSMIEGKSWYTLDKYNIPKSSTAVWIGLSPWKGTYVKKPSAAE